MFKVHYPHKTDTLFLDWISCRKQDGKESPPKAELSGVTVYQREIDRNLQRKQHFGFTIDDIKDARELGIYDKEVWEL